MNNDVGALKKLMMRAFPGLGGWHVKRYAKILNVYPYQGTERQNPAMVVADLELLTPDLKKDLRFLKPLMRIPLTSGDPWSDSMPTPGAYCLIEHPYWRADQAIVSGYLYTGRKVKTVPGIARLGGGLGVELGSAEDAAVLGGILQTQLETLIDLVDQLGAGGTASGGPLVAYAVVAPLLATLKQALPAMKSTGVKVGMLP